MRTKLYFVAILLFLFPASLCRLFFCIFRVKKVSIGRNVKVGLSIILSPEIILDENSSIGNFNYIRVDSFRCSGEIKYLNVIKGRINVVIENGATIHSLNKVSGVSIYKQNHFIVRKDAQIVIRHLFNVSDSIEIGERTCIAGAGSQMWTHSFLFGKDRHVRVDGGIKIGNNCYIGARVVICPGVTITDNVTIGANTTIAKNIDKEGLYVSQPIRYIAYNPDEQMRMLGVEVSSGIYRKDKSLL